MWNKMKQNGREEEKQENWSPSRPKVYSTKKSLMFQCVQLAYIATKTTKLQKSTKAINCYKDKMGRNQNREQKAKLQTGSKKSV